MSLRDEILKASDIPTEQVEVPEWGVTVEVRGMSLAEREAIGQIAADALEAREKGGIAERSFNAATVVATSYDPKTGERIFTDADIHAVAAKSASAVMRLADAGQRLSGLSDESALEAGKDSPSTTDDGSSSS